jgi:hypothetical protein
MATAQGNGEVTLRDPSHDTCPDYTTPAYLVVLQGLMAEIRDQNNSILQPARTPEQAANILRTAWQTNQDLLIEAFKKQQETREAERLAVEQAADAKEAERKAEMEAELEKNRVKFPDWEVGRMLLALASNKLCDYAVKALKQGKYVPLYLFLPAAIAKAQSTFGAYEIGEVDLGDGMKLTTNNSAKLPAGCVDDSDLTFAQMSHGMAVWLKEMIRYNYPEKHIEAWNQGWHALQNKLQYRGIEGLGDRVIVEYISQARSAYYEAKITGNMFDPALVAEERLFSIKHDLGWRDLQNERVSLIPLNFPHKNEANKHCNHLLSPPVFFYLLFNQSIHRALHAVQYVPSIHAIHCAMHTAHCVFNPCNPSCSALGTLCLQYIHSIKKLYFRTSANNAVQSNSAGGPFGTQTRARE